ncbi:universal stress protein [Ruegeria marina]|uniref:Nucleotide-binding universal stress protein, UspA family n=1 Tax=Ruegeria marina TaxID=639004 RepID=A0A1G7ETU9_9RHOB|nr:universal stress protein [Ruegeria marina]SDE67007.1 Nucleotide-binding universal stress protein, UspA family [Ruegeria marina]
MFKHILVPVDLAHVERLTKALGVAAEMARSCSAPVTYIAIAEETPGPVGHNPKEFLENLQAFARGEAEKHGIAARAHMIVSTDPAAEINRSIRQAAKDLEADLVVMASHPPTVMNWILPSHAGNVAEHSDASVFVVR